MQDLNLIVDLHTHTRASDGILTPRELIDRAVQNNVNVIAITDHDTVNGIDEAQQYITRNKLPIKLITGCEISTLWHSTEIHIVGLNLDINNANLLEFLKNQKQYRIERAKSIAYKLSKVNIKDAYDLATKYANGDIVSRAHFARFLVDNGHVPDMKRAFKKYLGKSGYAYVNPKWNSIDSAINIIHKAQGSAVLAHPSRYDLTLTKMKKLIQFFKLSQGDAIEVIQSRLDDGTIKLLAKCANEHELLASQGSDFHGSDAYLDVGKTKVLPQNVTPVWHKWLNKSH